LDTLSGNHESQSKKVRRSEVRKSVACFLCAVFVLVMATIAFADPEEEAKGLVEYAAKIFNEKGKDYAIKLLNSSSGPFRKGEVYVFAMNFDGVMLAHAANRDLVGSSQAALRDGKGELIFPPMLAIAKGPGTGWTEYYWLRHGEKEPTLKRTYIKRVPGEEILLGAGYYIK
jgi:cytochrome c